jgi:alpha-D-ribose 1-methylphosphonate 5-triphosphate synthase subunit PhnH
MALLDHEVSFAVAGEGARDAQELLLHLTGSRTAPLSGADFVLVLGGDSWGGLFELKRGTLEDPEDGATAVYAVEEISELAPLVLRLSGPGIPGERTVRIKGLADAEVEAIRRTRAHYPLGVDVYLVSQAGSVLGLPRSTQVEVMR